MAKKAMVEREKRRERLVEQYEAKRAALKAAANDRDATPAERFQASVALAKLPRNSAKIRQRNRCEITGRPRGYYRKLGMSRIALRELGSQGKIPGLVKSSW